MGSKGGGVDLNLGTPAAGGTAVVEGGGGDGGEFDGDSKEIPEEDMRGGSDEKVRESLMNL